METNRGFDLLSGNTSGLALIPSGKKESVFFILNNEKNMDKRVNKLRSSFSDDCGAWNAKAGTSPKTDYILSENGDLRVAFRSEGYCIPQSRLRERQNSLP